MLFWKTGQNSAKNCWKTGHLLKFRFSLIDKSKQNVCNKDY